MSIAEFYDRHPYPPAPPDLRGYADRWRDPDRLRAAFHRLFPWRPYDERRSILVAGCGTAQAARYAIRHPRATVMGIDVSSASLEHEQRLARRHGLTNLELRELPIERVTELGERFDEIVCTGVLHHLADPELGLARLAGVLKADGALHLMVYARYGRTGVEMMSEYARRLGLSASPEDIADLARTLPELPADHPLRQVLREAPDFRSAEGLADALLNPRVRSYTVPEVFDLLDGAGLCFARWYRTAPYSPRCGIVSDTPHGTLLGNLPPREGYAAMELFRGTMVMHSLVAWAGDAPDTWATDPLSIDEWEALVPIRLPAARTLEERLPAGASAVLLNSEHTYPDLVLPIAGYQKRLLDGVDGHRTVGEVAAGTGIPPDRTRAFFGDLWRWDQVVFDGAAALDRP